MSHAPPRLRMLSLVLISEHQGQLTGHPQALGMPFSSTPQLLPPVQSVPSGQKQLQFPPPGIVVVVVPALQSRPHTLPAVQQTSGAPQATGLSAGHGARPPPPPPTPPRGQQDASQTSRK